jgi:hypothetical protein
MNRFVRILFGTTLVVLCGWASVSATALLAFADIFPRDWWAEHSAPLFVLHEAVCYAPFILIVGFVLTKVFVQRPVANALACVAFGLLICNSSLAFESHYYVVAAVGEIIFFNCALLVGVPASVYFIGRIDSRRATSF